MSGGYSNGGWTERHNVRIDTLWAGGSAEAIRKHSVELAALAPDIILTHGGTTVGSLLTTISAVPIVSCRLPTRSAPASSFWRIAGFRLSRRPREYAMTARLVLPAN
jgi:hypothetical protein